jgi:hypothetical protein
MFLNSKLMRKINISQSLPWILTQRNSLKVINSEEVHLEVADPKVLNLKEPRT